MKSLQLLVLFGACIAIATGHMCLLSPKQRGSLVGINKPGATDCGLTDGPCGGRAGEHYPISVMSGNNFTFVFQKNLDHFAKATPGYFSLSVAEAVKLDFVEIGRVPDQGEPSLSVYTATLMLPKVEKPEVMTLQAKYVTNNKTIDNAIFYECSDLILYPKP